MIHHISEKTEQTIERNQIKSELIKGISYKFGESIVNVDRYNKKSKPNLKIKSGRANYSNGEGSSNHSQDLSGVY